MSRSARKMGRMLPAEYRRRFGNRFPVVPRLRSAEGHARAVAHHRLAVAEGAAAGREDARLVPERLEFGARLLRHELFDIDVASLERDLRKAPGFERFLDVKAEVNDVGDKLRVRLR